MALNEATLKRQGKTRKKKFTITCTPEINSQFLEETFRNDLKRSFQEGASMTYGKENVLDVDPFSVCTLPNFIHPIPFVEQLKEELADQIFYEKNNDLYKFQQTDDFKKISSPYIKAMRKFLYTDVRKWLCNVTGLVLTEKVDSTCSRYDYTDVLLCHDDELDTRRIAFILYLVPVWKQDDGGLLDLYDMDAHLQPKDIVKSITPAFNQFLWFEVTEASHHQVSEVLCECKSRLSVNGWFHAAPAPRPQRYIEPRAPRQQWTQVEEDVFYSWINPIYLDPEVQAQIQEKFENDSEIELQGFLQDEKYQALLLALKSDDISWKSVGPSNKRQFDTPNLTNCQEESCLPEVVKDCLDFLQSEMMFLTLSNLTGLRLHPMAASDSDSEGEDGEGTSRDELSDGGGTSREEEVSDNQTDISVVEVSSKDKNKPLKKKRRLDSHKWDGESEKMSESGDKSSPEKEAETEVETSTAAAPKCRSDIRRWKPGSYTLIHDTDTEGMEYALDAMLYCSCNGWEEQYGGYTSYIAKGEEEELLTVVPIENSLALVYRDKETLRFVKHINDSVTKSTTAHSQFYDISLTYFE